MAIVESKHHHIKKNKKKRIFFRLSDVTKYYIFQFAGCIIDKRSYVMNIVHLEKRLNDELNHCLYFRIYVMNMKNRSMGFIIHRFTRYAINCNTTMNAMSDQLLKNINDLIVKLDHIRNRKEQYAYDRIFENLFTLCAE